MEPVEVLELFDKRATIIKPGLERIRAALEVLKWPGQGTLKIVVAGTNGKGTTCGYLFRLLAASGVRVGLFSSPHLVEFRERISVSDRDISNQQIVRHIRDLKRQLPAELWRDLTFFEINTLLAFRIFDEVKTEINVLEVGLGGRLDCVNVYDPDLAIITSIGLDHQEFLGDTHAAIAREKAGIMRPGKPVVWGGLHFSNQEAHSAILKYAEEIHANLFIPENLDASRLPTMLRNKPQFLVRNFSLAFAAFEALISSSLCPKLGQISYDIAIERFDDERLPVPVTLRGRFDLIRVSKGHESRELLIDVCHNPHGAKALAMALEETGLVSEGEKRPCLICVLSDKDASGIWTELRGKISDVIRFKIPSSRSWDDSDQRIGGPMMDSFASAWSVALSKKEWCNKNPWLIFGSVAAVGDVLSFFQQEGWIIDRKFKD